MKKFWLLPFLLAYVAQAAILQAAEKGSDIQVVLTGPQSNQIHLPGTTGTINDTSFDGILSLPSLPGHSLRITASPSLCDNSVKQHSGYLDITEDRHLFFWFFEARNSPESAPLLLWLNGGPGCSSSGGLFFELGPCTITSPNSTVFNPHSWNEHANIIFLDSPVGTGWSYASDGSTVNSLAELATDVHAFLALFITNFPEYAKAPFHLAAESWGGHYAPNIASVIHRKNKEPGMTKINLASVVIVNGLTEPLTQFASVPDYACGGAPYPPLDPAGTECALLRKESPICSKLIQACYDFPSKLTCDPATQYCWGRILMPMFASTGLNPYDLRLKCDQEGSICYRELDWLADWMNEESHKRALGVDADRQFLTCNYTVNAAFYENGQAMLNSARLLPELIDDGIRVMAMAGDVDGVCSYMGVERWMQRLDHHYHSEFARAPALKWWTAANGTLGGEVRSAGPGAGNVTFVRVYQAGHMAPHDQPEATADLIFRWINNIPLVE